MPSPSPSYKGAGPGLAPRPKGGRPTRPIRPPEAQGIGTDPLLQSATTRLPALVLRPVPSVSITYPPWSMKDTWRAGRNQGDE